MAAIGQAESGWQAGEFKVDQPPHPPPPPGLDIDSRSPFDPGSVGPKKGPGNFRFSGPFSGPGFGSLLGAREMFFRQVHFPFATAFGFLLARAE